MIESQDIQFWQIRKRDGRRKPWEVRWRVNTHAFSRSFLTRALGENFRAKLVAAARAGETFSTATGRPVSWAQSAETLYAHARKYASLRWAESAANTRKMTAEGLTRATLAFLDTGKATRNRPDDRVLRMALRSYAFNPPTWQRPVPTEVAVALEWVAVASRPVSDLREPDAVRAVLTAMTLRADTKKGTLGAGSVRVHRAKLFSLLGYAVERKLLAVNPLLGIKTKQQRITEAIDPRRVPDPDQAGRLLAACQQLPGPNRRGPVLYAFYATMYYAGMRPAEVINLHAHDLTLPDAGWGEALLSGSRTYTTGGWTDDGTCHGERELKHRAPGEVRPVPLPPVLVCILRDHLSTCRPAPDGRLFWDGDAMAPVTGNAYRTTWDRARKAALTPAELAHGLAGRPYDLRHGNASALLNSGVPPTEVARRLGHTVAVLLTVYAHWFTTMEEPANRLIETVFPSDPPTCGNTGDGPSTGHHDGTVAS